MQGFPDGSVLKNPHSMEQTQVRSLGQEDPLEEEMSPALVLWPGESFGQRSLAGYSPRGCKESDTNEQLSTQPYKRTIKKS